MRNRCGDGPCRRVKRRNNASEHGDIQGCVEKKWYAMSKVSFREMKIILNQVTRALFHHLPAFSNYRSGCPRHYLTLSLCPLSRSLSEFERNFKRIVLRLSHFSNSLSKKKSTKNYIFRKMYSNVEKKW